MYFYMPKINKTQSDKKLKLPSIKRRNNRVALLKVHSIAMRLACLPLIAKRFTGNKGVKTLVL